jgi:biopolymer transport protein TolR
VKSNHRPANRLMNEINVVPYIDVMLVLLVIFMVTAPLMNPGLIDLPSVAKALAPPVAPLEVIIKRDSSLALRDHAASDSSETRVTQDELVAILKARQGRQAEQAVVISADRNVRYDAVIKVMDLLQQQHIQKVGLLTQSRK